MRKIYRSILYEEKSEMTAKVEYDSFAKFLVSLGVIFMVTPVFLISFILQENQVLLIKAEELLMVTEKAKKIIEQKQEWYIWMLDNGLYIVCVLLGIGIILVILGCRMWYVSQMKIDKKQELELQEVENRVKALTEKENDDKIQQEILEIERVEISGNLENVESYSVEDIRKIQNEVRDKNRIIHRFLTYKLKWIERTVSNMISIGLGENYETKVNVKINDMEYDVLSEDKRNGKNYIFEIKYLFNSYSWNSVGWETAIYRLYNQVENYKRIVGKEVTPILIIVTLEDQIKKVRETAEKFDGKKGVNIYILSETEIDR